MKYLLTALTVSMVAGVVAQSLRYSEFTPVINSAKGGLDSSGIFLVTQTKPGGGLKTYRTTIGDVVQVADTLLGGGWRLTGNANTDTSNFLGTTDAKDLVIKTNNTEAMRIDTNGNVGIGTAVPSEGLHIQKKGLFWNTTDTTQRALYIYQHDTTSSSSVLNISETGVELNTTSESFAYSALTLERTTGHIITQWLTDTSYFSIGTSTPTAKLHVNGTTRLEGTPQSTTSDSLLTIDGQGNVAWRTPYYYGTDTLTNGVDTVWTSDVTANSNIQLTSNGLNGSTQSGHLDVTEISAGNYFVVNSLKANTTVETGDQRKYYWFFIRKP